MFFLALPCRKYNCSIFTKSITLYVSPFLFLTPSFTLTLDIAHAYRHFYPQCCVVPPYQGWRYTCTRLLCVPVYIVSRKFLLVMTERTDDIKLNLTRTTRACIYSLLFYRHFDTHIYLKISEIRVTDYIFCCFHCIFYFMPKFSLSKILNVH